MKREAYKLLAGLVILISCMTFLWWSLGVRPFFMNGSNLPAITPNTAFCFLMSGISLLLLAPRKKTETRRTIGQLLSVACLLIAIGTAFEYLVNDHDMLLVDRLFKNVFSTEPEVFRMSAHTATIFIISSVSLLFLCCEKKVYQLASQWLAIIVMVFPVIVVIGIIYRQTLFYMVTDEIGMSLVTAISFVFLSAGVLSAVERQGPAGAFFSNNASGYMLRRVLPAMILVPILLDWIFLYGEGEGLYAKDFGVAISEVATTIIMVVVVFYAANKMSREEENRLNIEQQLIAAEIKMSEFASYLEDVREKERKAVAHDIHDDMGGLLAAIKMDVGRLTYYKEQLGPDFSSKVEKVSETADLAINNMRRIISDLRPSILDELGLFDAMDWQISEFSKRYGIDVESNIIPVKNSYVVENELCVTNIFRIFQEILNNIAKHSSATKVRVIAEMIGQDFRLSVRDNGDGLHEGALEKKKAYGIIGMKERVRAMGGEFSIQNIDEAGLKVQIVIPITN